MSVRQRECEEMFRKHVTRLSSPYCHDQLPPQVSRAVAEHLLACPSCHAEFDDVKLGAKFAGHLEVASAPDAIWKTIAGRLDRGSGRSHALSFLKPLAIAASIVLVVTAVFLVRRNKPDAAPPSLPSWRVAKLVGTPHIGTAALNDQANLSVGQWLETDANSRAQLDVANIGNVEIDPNTRVRLIETKPTEHRLELQRGRLSARISAPPKLFFVNTPSGVAEDLGCAYTLEVDDQGNSVLHVTLGWVAMQLIDRESTVPAGAACATRKGVGVGTPYFEDATPVFRAALAKFDFEGAAWKSSAVDLVLHDARPRDAMTIWYLLSRVNETDRSRVYDRLAELVAPPDGVTRVGVLSLNPQMLDSWREAIDNAREEGFQEKVLETIGRARRVIKQRLP